MTEPTDLNAQTTNVRLTEGESAVVDLAVVPLHGPSGVLWGLDSPQLNVNFVTIGPGESVTEHVNTEVDVLLIVVSGSGRVVIDGQGARLGANSIALVPRGSSRSIHSDDAMVYYSIHTRRSGLKIGVNASAPC